MEQLIQALTAYTSTLEQQLAALEARVAQLETQLEEANKAIKVLGERRDTNEAKGEKLEESEIEVELIMEDEEVLDTLDDLDILEEAEDTTEPEPIVEPIIEAEPDPVVITIDPTLQVVEEVTPVVESTPVVEKPAPRPAPTQTSLFGTAVEDIRQAISLGDRFLFQRELFAGNGELMQKTLDELNALGSLNEAMEYVAEKFDWDKESTAVQLFENVLKRRFS
jgi:multidrug efflux pump subunit AcrA (membrane-fusion protein)